MRQLTPIDAPTGSRRLPDEIPVTPLTAPERPRTPRGRLVLFVVTLVAIGAAAATVLVGRGAAPPTTGGTAAEPDRGAATRLVASVMPESEAFEPELAADIGESGVRVDTEWSPAGTSLGCDTDADPPLPAERHRIAVASAGYATGAAAHRPTGRSERLTLTAVALAPAGAGRVLDDLTAAVSAACADNPLSAMRDARLGSLPNVEGVVYRAHHAGVPGDGPDPAVTCVLVRQGDVVLRSCGLAADDRVDGLAVRGLDALRVRLEQALRDADLPPPPAQVRTPTWERAPVVTARRNAYVPGCTLLTSDQVAAASGHPVTSFDRAACRWELRAGWVRLSAGGFGSGLVPAHRSVLRGNSAVFTEPGEGECVYKVATNTTAALRINVSLTDPGTRPCAVARQLLALAFDRLPPA